MVVDDLGHHARGHVIEIMAVEQPPAGVVRIKGDPDRHIPVAQVAQNLGRNRPPYAA